MRRVNWNCDWTIEEDEFLKSKYKAFTKSGSKNVWEKISELRPEKSGVTYKTRWTECLNQDDINKGTWTPEEDKKLLKLRTSYREKWITISETLRRTPSRCYMRYYYLKHKERRKNGGERQKDSLRRDRAGSQEQIDELSQPTGLENPGNLCYMNATLQCLNKISEFVHFFLNEDIRKCVRRNKDAVIEISTSLARIFKTMNSGTWLVSVHNVKLIFAQLHRDFEDEAMQHDAHEFLTHLLNRLHKELNMGYSKGSNTGGNIDGWLVFEPFDPEDLSLQKDRASRVWLQYENSTDSLIKNLFCGQTRTRRQCLNCKAVKINFDVTLIIQLPLPQNTGNLASIEECFEKISDLNRISWECSVCGGVCDANEKTQLWKLPRYMIVQLKRFQDNGEKSKIRIKYDVNYHLELSKFMAHGSQKFSTSYELFGIVNHIGFSTQKGHYTAFCKRNDIWNKFDDDTAAVVSSEYVGKPSNDAYMLFYRSKLD